MFNIVKYVRRIATATAVAIVVCGCSSKLRQADAIDLSQTPVQIVDNMFAVQTKDGVVLQRMEADEMLRFSSDTLDYELFPKGLNVYAYTEDGRLETYIRSDEAKHINDGKKSKGEVWEAYGNVVISNVIKNETMETDTIYWDRNKAEIYTDCYVKLYSSQGLVQGKGMRSDDRARNATLLSVFDSFGITESHSTKVAIDTANFIGPLLK
ncbi:MAG TPA: LPS export ABC transporter periplasmic protein LptC [Rikenellaceae bacterium]|nr:LPS export ABC transporter periplasmic protein LptC [Rikenellaceae bacterium]